MRQFFAEGDALVVRKKRKLNNNNRKIIIIKTLCRLKYRHSIQMVQLDSIPVGLNSVNLEMDLLYVYLLCLSRDVNHNSTHFPVVSMSYLVSMDIFGYIRNLKESQIMIMMPLFIIPARTM